MYWANSGLHCRWQSRFYDESISPGRCVATATDDGGIDSGLSEVLKLKAKDVDWRAIAGFRNILVHDYLGGIDLEQVWDAVENYLPGLEVVARELMGAENE